jgi:hypothetical protein
MYDNRERLLGITLSISFSALWHCGCGSEDLGDAGGSRSRSRHPQRRSQAGPASADDDHVLGVLGDFKGAIKIF